MATFRTMAEAQTFLSTVVDRPIPTETEVLSQGLGFTQSSIDLGRDRFTNSYDLAFNAQEIRTDIVAFDGLTCVRDFLAGNTPRPYKVAASGGFFYLADKGSASPRQLALNLSISRGDLRSLPVADRESVMAGDEGLEVRPLVALGHLSLNGHDLEWSGSLTDYDTEVKVFSNGNAVIMHQQDPITGFARVLDEDSRYTPPIEDDDYMDVGFIGRGENNFIGVSGSADGKVDIFAHDFVLRCHKRYLESNSELQIHSVGGIALSRFRGGAFSAGPALNIVDFHNHPVNRDASLGSRPPFADIPLARTALYRTEDGLTHIRLFDGRPGSPTFPGVTPKEVAQLVMADGATEWGCFLDPGQTAKLCVAQKEGVTGYGNRHYMRWPAEFDEDFVWVPDTGRPVANVIAL